jgi:hypothetical protein
MSDQRTITVEFVGEHGGRVVHEVILDGEPTVATAVEIFRRCRCPADFDPTTTLTSSYNQCKYIVGYVWVETDEAAADPEEVLDFLGLSLTDVFQYMAKNQ